jgi:hypothetical protein
MKYIALRVRTAMLVHGYTAENQEVIEEFHDEPFLEKLIAIERIQSVTEKYLLVSSTHGRVMYWEYEGDLDSIAQRLNAAGLLIA